MKSQVKLALFFFTAVGLSVGGVVRMTDLPEAGEIGFEAPEILSFEQRRIADYLQDSVEFQCNDIGRRSTRFSPQNRQFMEYLASELEAYRFDVEIFEYEANGETYQSVIGRKDGSRSGNLLIGTHHDSYSRSLCANASATGVATVLEVARAVQPVVTEKSITIAIFGTGEQPHRGTDTMGSNVWLNAALKAGESFDQAIFVGSFGSFRPGTTGQTSSFPWYIMYPESTDWVGIYGGFGDNDLVTEALGIWDRVTEVPARGFATPTWMLGIPAADQVPFMDAGIPTLFFSDTGSERDPNLRGEGDGPYVIVYEEMATRVEALSELVKVYADR